jgi:hypothetical protein
MFDHSHYVPILKGKAGEYQAIRDLDPGVKDRLTPLVEVPSIPWDYENDRPGKTVDEHVANVPGNIEKHWGVERTMFVDLLWIPSSEAMATGSHPLSYVFNEARTKGLQLIPVTGLSRDTLYQDAVRETVARDRRGVCIRLESSDFEELLDIDTTLEGFLNSLGVIPGDTDLIVDFKEISAGQASPLTIAIISIMRSLSDVGTWRSITLAASGFPMNLSNFDASSVTAVPRAEWSIWQSLALRRTKLPRLPTFGDYVISHPDMVEIDPRLMRMSAQLRYTTEADWLIFKGRNVRDYGYEQFNDICRIVAARPEFSGEGFSWADAFIANCGAGYGGPGNATTWRRVGTNHHLTLVTRQIANFPGL